MVCSGFNSLQSVTVMRHHGRLAFGTLYLAHDKQPPAPPLLLHLILARSKHTNLSIRSTTLRRILSWIPPPLSVDPVHLWRSLWEISTVCLVHSVFCTKRRIDFGAATSSFFLIEHCFQWPFCLRRFRNCVGFVTSRDRSIRKSRGEFLPAWT